MILINGRVVILQRVVLREVKLYSYVPWLEEVTLRLIVIFYIYAVLCDMLCCTAGPNKLSFSISYLHRVQLCYEE